jgi:hypothetical protein
MSDAAAKLGWLTFVAALAGAVLRRGPDAPLDAAMKSAGVYQSFLLIIGLVIFLVLVHMALTIRKAMATQRHLDQLRRKGR